MSIQKSNEKRRSEDSQGRYSQVEQGNSLQTQINILAETCMRLALNQDNQAGIIKEIVEVAGTNFTTDEDFDELVNKVLNS